MTLLLRIAFVPALFLASGCDNVGRVWDPDLDPTNPGDNTTETLVEVVAEGGVTIDGRPKVRAAFPKDGGWPREVPIVVEFTESVNTASIGPTSATATDARIVVRVQGTTNALPCAYDFLANNRLLVMRPAAPLSNEGTPTYEVVLTADARDCDGVRFDVPAGGKVLTQFQVNQDESFADGRVLTVYPRDNAKDLTREGSVFVVFDRPATVATLSDPNIQLRPAGGQPLTIGVGKPLQPANQDGRVAQVTPGTVLDASTQYELVLTENVLFANDGVLDFRGRTPFARFDTIAPRAPQTVALGNPTPSTYANKVNINNFATAVINVTTPVDTQPGDRVHARIYGGDKSTTPTGDFAFVERTVDVTQAGPQTIAVDFSGKLGTLERLTFDEGELTFAAQILRGSQQSGYKHQAESADPLLDVTRPTVTTVGPPVSADGRDILCDLNQVTLFGVASEPLGEAQLTAGTAPLVQQFAAADDGRFLMLPVNLGRLAGPIPYALTVTDLAGNMAAASFQGNLVQRGVITGALAGSLTIEAYDEATLLPVAGAKVVVDVGAPVVPHVPTFPVAATDAAGRLVYDNVTAPSHTITIVAPGYHLATIYDTRAAFVSLPLRPLANATATLTGSLGFQTSAGTAAIVSSSAFASRSPTGVRTATTTPTSIVPTPILPNRPQVVTAFAGTFEPTANPPFTAHGAPVLGGTFTTPTPPAAPVVGGADATLTFGLIPSSGQLAPINSAWPIDFGLATGLDLGALVGGGPRARLCLSLDGFEGQVVIGVGFAPAPAGTTYSFEGSYSLPIFAGFAQFTPRPWALAEAQDTSGRISRTRALFQPPQNTFLFGIVPAPIPIPVITPPSGPATTAPAVTFVDAVDGSGFTLATVDVSATDTAGRRWLVYVPDRDAAGGTKSVQFPDITSAGLPGLALGSWSVLVESRVWSTLTGCTADDCLLTERVRTEVQYAKAASEVFTVQ